MGLRKSKHRLEVHQALKELFPNYEEAANKALAPEDIEWMPNTVNKKQGRATWASYITARKFQSLLQDAFGGLATGVIEEQVMLFTKNEGTDKEKDINISYVKATVKLIHPQTFQPFQLGLSDVSGLTDIESIKGGVSGAYKRVASSIFPCCRDLYDFPTVFSELDNSYAPKPWTVGKALDTVSELYLKGELKSDDMVIIAPYNGDKYDWRPHKFEYGKKKGVLGSVPSKPKKKEQPKAPTPKKQNLPPAQTPAVNVNVKQARLKTGEVYYVKPVGDDMITTEQYFGVIKSRQAHMKTFCDLKFLGNQAYVVAKGEKGSYFHPVKVSKKQVQKWSMIKVEDLTLAIKPK